MKRSFVLALALAVSAGAFATNNNYQPPKPSDPSVEVDVGVGASSEANAAALAGAISGSKSSSDSTAVGVGLGGKGGNSDAKSASVSAGGHATGGNATGGNATSAGGAGGAGGEASSVSEGSTATSQSDGSSNNVYNSTTTYQRNVPTMIMGTVIPVDCGFGGQAGGASTTGSGFLGMSWTTETCYTLKVANAFAAVGQYDMACELWVAIVHKKLKKLRGIEDVDCKALMSTIRYNEPVVPEPVQVNVAAATPVVVPTNGATKADLDNAVQALTERMDRMYKSSLGK